MLKFTIDTILTDKIHELDIQEIDVFPDCDGYIRYLVQTGKKESIIYIDMDYYRPPIIITEGDAMDYYERIFYPEQPFAFCEDNTFTSDEIMVISDAIVKRILH